MRKPKFKVGDKVRVLRASTEDEHDLWGDRWCGWMSRNIGRVLIVELLQDYDNHYEYYKYHLDGFWYPEFVLENEIQVGQQLVFNFMKE